MLHSRRGRCACVSVLLAALLLPVIAAHPLLGFVVLVWLLSSGD